MARTMREEVADFKRASILKAAAREFYERGYDGTRIDEIASSLGVTKPFIYYYFRNKTEILDEICVQSTAISVDTLSAAIARHDTAIDQLRGAIRELAVEVVANQVSIAICFREEKYISDQARKRLEANRRHYDRLLTGLLSQANLEGVIAVQDPKIAAQVLTGAITWSFVWYRERGRLKVEELAENVLQLAMGMLREAG